MKCHDESPTFASPASAEERQAKSEMTSNGLPAEGIVAAFQFAELRQVRWQLGKQSTSLEKQSTSTVPVAESANSTHGRWADEPMSFADMLRKVPKSVGACYDMIEAHMLRGPWVMGDAYTIADPYLFTLAQWLEDDGIDPERIPRVIEHRGRMAQLLNVRKAIAQELAN
jgi:glutathione S-transferase